MTLDDIWQSLREGFFMFWETLWPLILGFTLSGAVQAFAPREQMERVMGDHRPRAVARASGLGMVSSSCSYAATAMGKSLFQKGADFVTAMIFMFASTNLVIELGIVLIVLMGWQFAAAEFVGGPIMIVLLALTGSWVIKARLAQRARKRLESGMVGGHDHDAMVGVSHERQEQLEHSPWSVKLRSRGAWADAASYSIADLTMLRRELVLGYGIAGLLTVMVSTDTWNNVFLTGHGFWTTLENVIVGPFIAIISFVCSIGNIPMAAALWHGGISFGGVIAFIFGDLITIPLLLIYRKYYGGRLTLRLLLWFWAVMSTAGLITELLFDAAGLIPPTAPRPLLRPAFSGTTPPSSTSSSWPWAATSTGCTATASASAVAPVTPSTRSVGCRSRPPTPRPTSLTTASSTGSAPTAAPHDSPPIPNVTRPNTESVADPTMARPARRPSNSLAMPGNNTPGGMVGDLGGGANGHQPGGRGRAAPQASPRRRPGTRDPEHARRGT